MLKKLIAPIFIIAIIIAVFWGASLKQERTNEAPALPPDTPIIEAEQDEPAEEEPSLPVASEEVLQFIALLKPTVLLYNNNIKSNQKRLYSIKKELNNELDISEADFFWLKSLMLEFRMAPASRRDREFFKHLDRKVQAISPQLVLAAAWVLSDEGKNQAAIELNNYFNLYCFEPGCGSTKLSDDPELYEVESFRLAHDSVVRFMEYLNGEAFYEGFRTWRAYGANIDALPEQQLISGIKNEELIKAWSIFDQALNPQAPEPGETTGPTPQASAATKAAPHPAPSQ